MRGWTLGIALAAVFVLATTAIALAQGSGATPLPEPSGSPPAVLPGEPNPPWDDGATPAEPDPSLVAVRPIAWNDVLVAPDGRTLDVYFTNGDAACHGLARVDVAPSDSGVRIVVYVGDVANASPCPDTTQLYRTTVVLDAPAISGGNVLDLPAG
jgi:hypothetical protein